MNRNSEQILDNLFNILGQADKETKTTGTTALNSVSVAEVPRRRKIFKCSRCHKCFTILSNLRRHIRQIHSINLSETTSMTSTGTITKDKKGKIVINLYLMRKDPENKLTLPVLAAKDSINCSTCSAVFNHFLQQEVHICLKRDIGSIIQCHCRKKFYSEDSYQFHRFFHSAVVVINRKCSV
jgi:hypothetical protein